MDADETVFTCLVSEPRSGKIQGTVHAFRSGTHYEVGRLAFAYKDHDQLLQTIS